MNQYTKPMAAPAILWPADAVARPKAQGAARHTPGFGPLTPVETNYGAYPAQALRLRDMVRLRSGRFCPIARIDRLLLDEAFLDRNDDAQPVLVQAGRLGYGLPKQPVLLAPGQRLSGGQGFSPTLRTAHDLHQAGMALRSPEKFLTYVVFSFEEPEDVCSHGLWLRVDPPSGPVRDEDEA